MDKQYAHGMHLLLCAFNLQIHIKCHVQVHRINKAAASIAKQAAKDVQEATGN